VESEFIKKELFLSIRAFGKEVYPTAMPAGRAVEGAVRNAAFVVHQTALVRAHDHFFRVFEKFSAVPAPVQQKHQPTKPI